MKPWTAYLILMLGALAAPGLCLASGPETVIKNRYPEARIESVHTDEERRDWVYRVTPHSGQPFFVAYGRARSRSGYYYVLLSAAPDGKILSVELPNYPHSQGRMATTTSFLKQYLNKTEVRYGRDIHAVTGATSTAKSTADTVRQLLALIKRSS